MITIRLHPRLRRVSTRAGSLILLFQRLPVIQMLFPEAQFLGGNAVANSLGLAVTTVIGLGAYDSVAGATAVAQVSPVSGSSTVPVSGGQALNFLFQITGGGGHTPKSWSVVGTLPSGLSLTKGKVTAKTNTITGTTNQNGNFPITIKAWENNNYNGRSATGSFTITVTGGGTPASITTDPVSKTINSGSTTTLTVVASGTSPFTYEWYEGSKGTTTTPVGSNSASFTTPPLTSNTKYWVKVKNALNTSGANSNAATITVNQPAAIDTDPVSKTINSGSTTTLTVTASGTGPFTYQWYQGSSGTTTTPVGSNSASFTTPALTSTTRYWVKVKNAANNAGANSSAATISVNQPAAIATPPASIPIDSGDTITLTVSASGTAPFTYQWYQGSSGITTTPVGTNSSSFTTPALVNTTLYWVKVTNSANTSGANSAAATITIRSAYDSWVMAAGFPANESGPMQNPAKDGIDNLLKFAFNLNPAQVDVQILSADPNDISGLPAIGPVNGRLHIEYIRRKVSSNPGITYTAQCGSDLDGWALLLTSETVSPIGITSWERVSLDGPADETQSFGRVKVSESP